RAAEEVEPLEAPVRECRVVTVVALWPGARDVRGRAGRRRAVLGPNTLQARVVMAAVPRMRMVTSAAPIHHLSCSVGAAACEV
ncbi:MAG TPA: hypothetical protein VK988_13775, partial [Acidimicrobiales bacterium]|nr:hypothetical protein [Acidimicrobiales bacterium]